MCSGLGFVESSIWSGDLYIGGLVCGLYLF